MQSIMAKKKGLVTSADLAELLDVPYATLRMWTTTGQFPEGSIQIGKRRYYTPEEVKALRKSLKEI